jgi:hypothetical protein
MPTANVSFDEQDSNGTAVFVEEITLPEGGFVAIHEFSGDEDEPIGTVVGVSEYLEPGTHEEVTVHLFDVRGMTDEVAHLGESQELLAVAYRETNANRQFDFVETNGQVDEPYLDADDEPVYNRTFVTVESTPKPTTESPATEGETAGESGPTEDSDGRLGANSLHPGSNLPGGASILAAIPLAAVLVIRRLS